MRGIGLLLLGALVSVAGLPEAVLGQDAMSLATAIVTAADRSPEDRALDAGRKPAEMLTFLGIQLG